jgi:nitrate reductase NapE component
VSDPCWNTRISLPGVRSPLRLLTDPEAPLLYLCYLDYVQDISGHEMRQGQGYLVLELILFSVSAPGCIVWRGQMIFGPTLMSVNASFSWFNREDQSSLFAVNYLKHYYH